MQDNNVMSVLYWQQFEKLYY